MTAGRHARPRRSTLARAAAWLRATAAATWQSLARDTSTEWGDPPDDAGTITWLTGIEQALREDAERYAPAFDRAFPVLAGELGPLPWAGGITLAAPMTRPPERPLRPLPPGRACRDVPRPGWLPPGKDPPWNQPVQDAPPRARPPAGGWAASCTPAASPTGTGPSGGAATTPRPSASAAPTTTAPASPP